VQIRLKTLQVPDKCVVVEGGCKMSSIMKILAGEKRGCRKGPEAWFTGTVWLNEIVNPSAPSRLKANHVWFGPGSRTAWHTHPIGQTLHVPAKPRRRFAREIPS
jgi:hypothetical protein